MASFCSDIRLLFHGSRENMFDADGSVESVEKFTSQLPHIHETWRSDFEKFTIIIQWLITISHKLHTLLWSPWFRSQKYESQLGWWFFPIYGKVKVMFQENHQPDKSWFSQFSPNVPAICHNHPPGGQRPAMVCCCRDLPRQDLLKTNKWPQNKHMYGMVSGFNRIYHDLTHPEQRRCLYRLPSPILYLNKWRVAFELVLKPCLLVMSIVLCILKEFELDRGSSQVLTCSALKMEASATISTIWRKVCQKWKPIFWVVGSTRPFSSDPKRIRLGGICAFTAAPQSTSDWLAHSKPMA